MLLLRLKISSMQLNLRTTSRRKEFLFGRMLHNFETSKELFFKTFKLLWILTILLKCTGDFSIAVEAAPVSEKEALVCEYYNKDQCKTSVCNQTETCAPVEEGKRAHCYALWDNATTVRMKGCWLDHTPCYNQRECVVQDVVDGRMFCCCEGSYCNANLIIPSVLPTHPPRTDEPKPQKQKPSKAGEDMLGKTILLTIVPLILVSIVILFVYFLCRNYQLYARQRLHINQYSQEPDRLLPSHEGKDISKVENTLPHWPIEKIEVKAHGRFANVWKARTNIDGEARLVAVKIFPMQDRMSWLTEKDFYTTVLRHENILRFYTAEQHDIDSELWLITEYHERGSLYDHLKSHTITVTQLITIALTMYRGISYLHSVAPECSRTKPPMAHRDIKSRNVLLKSDMTACIADFGLLLNLGPGMGTVHNQVGTRRYMAPEVLDGSINFCVDNFLKIDIYASALILWELLSRCSLEDNQVVSEYLMPFEIEAGQKPTLEKMQEVVVTLKARPHIPHTWHQHSILSGLCSTVEECWDQDPEARLSAECVEARLALLHT